MAANPLLYPYEWAPVSDIRDPAREQAILAMLGQTPMAEYANLGGERVRGGGSMPGSRLDLGYAGGGYGNMAYEALRDPTGSLVGQREYLDTYAPSALDKAIELMVMYGVGSAGAGIYGAAGGAGAGSAGGAGSLEAADAVYAGAGGYGGGAAELGAAGVGGGGAASGIGGGATAGGGIGGSANALYQPTGYAGAGMGGTAGGTATAGGAGGLLGSMGGANTWANLAQAGLGIAGQQAALNEVENANAASNDLLRYVYDTNRADNKPLVDLRNSVLPQIQGLLSNPGSITQDPGYQFQFGEGQKALNNGAAARGMTYSGAQGKALQRYGQDYGASKLDQSLNRLTTVAGLGQVGSNNNQQAANQFGQGMSQNAIDMGNARGGAYVGGTQLAGNALANIYDQNQWQRMWGSKGP